MRFKRLAALAVVPAAVLAVGLAAVPASASATGGPVRGHAVALAPGRPSITKFMMIEHIHGQAIPLTLSCPVSDDGFWTNLNGSGQVDHWYSGGHVFTAPYSAHQELCLHGDNNNDSLWQLVVVGGTANGDCVALDHKTDDFNAQGCVLKQGDETFRPVYFNNQPIAWQVTDGSNLCLFADATSGSDWTGAICTDLHGGDIVWNPGG